MKQEELDEAAFALRPLIDKGKRPDLWQKFERLVALLRTEATEARQKSTGGIDLSFTQPLSRAELLIAELRHDLGILQK